MLMRDRENQEGLFEMRTGLKFGAKTSSRCIRIGALGVLAVLPFLASPVSAQSCGEDWQKLVQRRTAAMASLNSMKKDEHGKLDAEVACPRIRNLAAVDGEIVAYVDKNKDWCNIPDAIVAQTKQAAAGDAGMASKACSVAAQERKAKQQQAQGGGGGEAAPAAPKLPSGPL